MILWLKTNLLSVKTVKMLYKENKYNKAHITRQIKISDEDTS